MTAAPSKQPQAAQLQMAAIPFLSRLSVFGPDSAGPAFELVTVHVPQKDGTRKPFHVYVCEMSARAKTEFDQAMTDDPQHPWDTLTKEAQDARLEIRQSEIRERLVIATACNEQGDRIFSYADIEALGQLGASVVEPLFLAARRLNKIQESLEQLGEHSGSTNVSVSS